MEPATVGENFKLLRGQKFVSDTQSNSEHKWSTDRPGKHPEHDDELGRKLFAQRVAKELRAWRQKDSLVVSLNGDWGSGKTTLANFIIHYIDDQSSATDETKPVVVKFNPWQWSGQDKLLEAFFDEIGAVFRRDHFFDAAAAKKLARFWEGLKVITVAGGELATKLQESLVAIAALLAGGSGMVSGFVLNPTLKTVFQVASMVLLGLAGVCAIYAPIAEKLSAVFKWKSSKADLTLEEIRNNLRQELGKLKAPLLIVIDDIDRLTKREMRLLVQLVKANADFPNMVYLLLYQKDVLANALGEITSEKGQDFLKKIVQVELEVPVAPEHEMHRFFREQIEPVLKRAKIRWERERWAQVFEEGIWPYFRTPRDIKRFKGVLEFYFEAHVQDGILEVNPIDLILLETLRMFDPVAYEAVGRAFQKQRNIFIETLFQEPHIKDQLVLGIKDLLDRQELTATEREQLGIVLYELFPQAREGFTINDNLEQEWLRDLRICHPKLFRRYFQLGADPNDISAAFIASLFATGNDRENIRALLKIAFDTKPFTTLMERLAAVRKDIPQPGIEPFVTALFDLSDDLPEIKNGLFSPDAERQLVHFAVQLLRRIIDENERTVIFRNAALASTSITGPVFCANILRPSDEDKQLKRIPIIPIKELDEIQSALLPKLWSVARSGKLWKMRMSTFLFYTLSKWAGVVEVRKWLADAILTPQIATNFLRTILNKSQVSGHRGTRTVYTLYPDQIERYTDLDKLAEQVAKAANDELTKTALEKLRIAIQNNKKNVPPTSIYVLSQDEDGHLFSDASDSVS